MESIALSTPDITVMAGAVSVALFQDLVFGEPPAWVHPVVAMGQFLSVTGNLVSRATGNASRPRLEFWSGALAWWLGAMLVVALAIGLWIAAGAVEPMWKTAVLGMLLKPLLSWRNVRDEVSAVEKALTSSLEAGRQRVSRLVSRDVTRLSESQVREAAVSTLAENLYDSVIAPLFWFAVAGLPGAALYRFANTADAMWGYEGTRSGRDWTWGGKWSARADDVLSWFPARITALLIAFPSGFRCWSAVVTNARLTPSPSGGWPLGALAVSLGIRLIKPGVYQLNAQGRTAQAQETAMALQRCGRLVTMTALTAGLTTLAANFAS